GSEECCVVFFFQAEDGIRDWSVTGVQTCALPILGTRPRPNRCCQRRLTMTRASSAEARESGSVSQAARAVRRPLVGPAGRRVERSEERRVGEEGGAGGGRGR